MALTMRLLGILNLPVRPATVGGAIFAALLLTALSPARAAIDQSDLSSTGGDHTRSLLGTGQGVIVGILDSGIDVNHPALQGSAIRSVDFTGAKHPDDSNSDTGHATGIAGIFLGHDASANYTGFAPSAKFINARIVFSDDWTTDAIAGNGLFYCVRSGAKVLNLSIGNPPADGPPTAKLSLMVDYASERYGASIVSAAGNENSSAVNYTPGGAYNGYSIGALDSAGYVRVTGFSNYAEYDDRRCKPDLVGPGADVALAAANWERAGNYYNGSGTSFSTPMVGGALTQMIGYGRTHGLSTSPLLLKSILLTSARKGWDNDGTPWAPRDIYQDSNFGLRIDEALDDEQGAGRLDAVAAYHVYARKATSATPVAKWKQGTLYQKKVYLMHLGDLSAGQRVDATLTWFRHVSWRDRDGNGVPTGNDAYKQKGTLADFALQLMRGNNQVVVSDSDYDNVEHLSWLLDDDGDYWLRVYRWEDAGLAGAERYALAARVLSNPQALPPLSVVSTRQAAAPSLTQAITAVPEPAALGLFMLAGLFSLRRSRK